MGVSQWNFKPTNHQKAWLILKVPAVQDVKKVEERDEAAVDPHGIKKRS